MNSLIRELAKFSEAIIILSKKIIIPSSTSWYTTLLPIILSGLALGFTVWLTYIEKKD